MARYTGPRNKVARRLGADLGLKTNPKSLERRINTPPGQHGRKGTRKMSDYGIQLAEKGALVLEGKSPGDIPWDYPRIYNIILNLKTAQKIGVKIPQDVIGAAYRVYTDYAGNYVGR